MKLIVSVIMNFIIQLIKDNIKVMSRKSCRNLWSLIQECYTREILESLKVQENYQV